MKLSWKVRRGPRSRGFSLVELLVVIAIIAALIAILLPAIQYARATARRSTSQSNLRNITQAILNYETANGFLPVAGRVPGDVKPRTGWMLHILPQLDRRDLYERYDFSKDWYHADNLAVTSTRLPVLLDPSSPAPERLDGRPETFAGIVGVTDYANIRAVDQRLFTGSGATGGTPGIDGPNTPTTNIIGGGKGLATGGTYAQQKTLGAFVNAWGLGALAPNSKARLADITDGVSHTIFLAESHGRPYLYQRGVKVSDDLAAVRVNGGGWSRNANDIRLAGFTKDGKNPIGSWGINAANGVQVNSSDGQAANWGQGGTHADAARDGSGGIYSFHPGGAHLSFGDSSVKFVSEFIDISVLAALATRDQNELVDDFNIDNPTAR
ncbi:MAG: DUF1559 domain-containing protein [Planctomycetes bacterium]|nr:DUF1559 domain-containing protein [Planctomycetota bacterium]